MRYLKFEDLKPIFVMGCQRSGTTMIASQLGAPNNAIALPELPFIINLLKGELEQKPGNMVYESLVRHRKFNTLEIRLGWDSFESVWNMNKAKGVIELIINEYLKTKGISLTTSRVINWIEHCPTNIDNFYILRKFFPTAKFINIVRDPRAVYASMKPMVRWEVAEPLKLSMVWLKAVGKGFLLLTKYPEAVIQVKYEEYVQDPSVLPKLCNFLGIEFLPEMKNGGGVILPNFTRSQHKLTMNKTSTDRINSWMKNISKKEEDTIISFCHEWMAELNYISKDYIAIAPSAAQKRIWFVKGIIFSIQAKLINKMVLRGILRIK